MSIDNRAYLKIGERILLSRNKAGNDQEVYQITGRVGEGGSAICYEAVRNRNGHLEAGLLKEFYPADDIENNIVYSIFRLKNGQIVPGAGTLDRFVKMRDEYMDAYNLLNDKMLESEDNRLMGNFIQIPELLYGRLDEDVESPAVYDEVDIKALSEAIDGAVPTSGYIWTRGVVGQSYGEFIKEIKRNPESNSDFKLLQVIQTVIALTEGVMSIHVAGLLHLDIKPSNFMLPYREGQIVNEHTISMYDVNTLYMVGGEYLNPMGTDGFCAPEIVEMEDQPDNRADIYSIGAVLFNAIIVKDGIGNELYVDETYGEIRQLVKSSKFFTSGEAGTNEEFMSLIVTILEKCLAPYRGGRYEACEDLLDDLEKALEIITRINCNRIGQNETLQVVKLNEAGISDPVIAIQKMLYDHPIYESLEFGNIEPKILVIGSGTYGHIFIDQCLQAGQIKGYKLHITSISDKADKDKESYLQFRPELTRFVNVNGSIEKSRHDCMYADLVFRDLKDNDDTFHFDCVIFDEASQITSENAVGAMYRANQIIIVGDNEQLPPTSFFDMSFDDEDDEEAEYGVYESILDEALTSLPKIMLKWHYRSKDESLITFSNKEIYHDLTTFPSCIKNDHLGLHYEFVPNGLYIHGKRINEAEGRRVVDLVMEIAKNNPAKSLGVVTFNMAQQSYIERLIHRERLKNQDCEEFFSEEREEPFFVKNLESVQGDERDIIIISSTFGPDSTGKLSLNFGPINKDGGYRRLNVAITRAKERVILATSLSPDMFNLAKTTNKGVIMLHDYIAFASNIKSSEFKENQTDNGMISSIARFLEEHEYKTVRNIGYSGYKIDLAVLDPNDPKHVILGILTDGENYQHLKTVKDRNSLIDNALSLRGWSLYHVWSLSYYKNPELYHNEIINILAHGEENHEECYNDVDYECEDSSNSITIDSLFMSYPDALKIINDAIHNEHSKEDAILKIIYELAPIRILDLKKLILPMYGKSRLTLNLEHEMEVELDKIISENGLHKVIGFVLKPSDLYGVDFRMYKSDLYYPKIDGIYVEELEDGFKRVIKHVKTTSKRILYSEFNTLVGYPKGSSQTKVYFDRVIDILSDKGIIEVNKDIIDYKEV